MEPKVVLIDGADARENRVVLLVGDKCSVDDTDDVERTESRG